MRVSAFVFAAAIACASAGDLITRQDSNDCQTTYNQCIANGEGETKCQCDLATCTGEDSARIRDFCATATAATGTASATASSTVSIITGQPSSQPSGQAPVTAPAGSLSLGEICSDTAQCANDAQCWGTTSFTIRRCGNFNAECENDSQCAYNTCNNGLCNGFLATSSSTADVATLTAGPGYNGTTTSTAGYNVTATGTGSYHGTATSTGVVQYTGAASRGGIEAGLALVAAFAAYIM